MRKIYVLFSCDDHKIENNRKFISATCSPTKIIRLIKRAIESGILTYGCDEELPEKQIDALMFEAKHNDLHSVFQKLCGGHVEVIEDGQAIQ